MFSLRKKIRIMKIKIMRKEYILTSRRYMEKTIFDMGTDLNDLNHSLDVISGRRSDVHSKKWHEKRARYLVQKMNNFAYDCLDELIH